MIRNILLGYDGSESANKALEFAVNLARTFNAQLHVLAVARPPEFGDEVETRPSSRTRGSTITRCCAPRTRSWRTRRSKRTARSRSGTPPSRSCATPRPMASITSSWVTAVTRSLSAG
jgi:nucleotide-binding universal stress UspA family protein